MGSSGIVLNDEPKVESTSLTKVFEQQCPYYMLYGMTYDEFWFGDPKLVKYYREYYKLKLREEDRYMWKQGMYVYEALCDVSPVLHAFSKKGTKPLQYRSQPMMEETQELPSEQEKEQQQKNDQMIARIFFERWARATKKQFENKK